MTVLTLGFLQFKAAQLLRLAEKSGSKTLGNTWYVSLSPFPDITRPSGWMLCAIARVLFLAGYQEPNAKTVLLVRE